MLVGAKGRAIAGLAALAVGAGLLTATSHSQTVHAAGSPAPGTITTYAGASPDNGFATTVALQPFGVAVYGSTLYLSDQIGDVVRAVDINTDAETVFAGNGTSGTTGDGGPATAAPLNGPRGLAVDSSGNVYIALQDRVRMVNTSGVISLVAVGFSTPLGLASDAAGDLFVADTGNNQIKRVDHSTKAISTAAGTGVPGFSGDTGPAASAQLAGPQGVAVDSTGATLWIADSVNQRIRKVTAGTINTVAGQSGVIATRSCTSGTPALTTLIGPTGIAFDGAGDLFITDTANQCIRELVGTNLTTVAGTSFVGYSGDGGPATSAKLAYPTDVAADASGNVFIADNLIYRVRKVTSGGIITTIAGTGTTSSGSCTYGGDGNLATNIVLCDTSGVAVDGAGDVFFSDAVMNVVRKVTPAGVLMTVAGDGLGGDTGDGGPATAAELAGPRAIAVDAKGDLLIAEGGLPDAIRMVDTSGIIHTVAGGGANLPGTSPVPATSVQLSSPYGIAVAPNGSDFYIGDTFNNLVEKVTVGTGTIAVVAGGGQVYPGDGGSATLAKIYTPIGVAVDGAGNLYISSNTGRVSKVDPSGIITTVAVFSGSAWSVATAPNGEVVVSSGWRLYALTPVGFEPIAGNGATALSGDGGPANLAGMGAEWFAFDAAGDIFIGDHSNNRVRRVQSYVAPTAPLAVSAIAGRHYATVQWSAPSDTGGLPVAQYTVRAFQGATPGPTVVTGATTALVGGLAAGVPYTFTVSAFNGWASGPESTHSAPVTPTVLMTAGDILTYAGAVGSGPASSIGQFPYSLALAGTHLYVGDLDNPVLRDVNLSTGQESALAGNDSYGYSGDGGPAAAAMIQGAGAMAYCGGELYFADMFNYVIRRIDGTGAITTVAGTGQSGYSGDGGPAATAEFGRILGLACRTGGGLYVLDSDNGAVRIIDAAGDITTWWSGFSFPTGIAELGAQNVVAISDGGSDNAVWRLTNPAATLIAGRPGYPGYSGDGYPAGGGNSQLNDPRGIAYLGGILYISDRINNVVRAVAQSGIITTAPFSALNGPTGLIADPAHNLLYLANGGSFTVMSANVTNNGLSPVAGNGTPSLSGDGGPATQAQMGNPYAVALDSAGNTYIADNQNAVIRKITPDGIITTFAGTGVAGYSGDSGPATAAQLNDPRGVAAAPNGDIYISDTSNNRVRKVDHSTGLISTVAGANNARAVAVDAAGNLYVANTGANQVYMVNTSGVETTIAGTGVLGFSGDGGLATAATLNQPRGLAVDSAMNVYVSDSGNNRVRRIDHGTGIITTVAGNGAAGSVGDGYPATSAELNFPFGLAVDGAGNLFIADELSNRIRVVNAHGTISSVVGTCGGIPAFAGDGGPAWAAEVNLPFGVAVDPFGDLFIADVNSNRVRAATGLAGLRAGSCQGPTGVPGGRANQPSGATPQSPRVSDTAGAPHSKPAAVPVATGRGSGLAIRPTRSVTKHSSTGVAPPARAPLAAQPAAAGHSAQARGRAAAAVLRVSAQSSLLPSGAFRLVLVFIPIGLLSLVVLMKQRRRRARA